MSMNRRRDITKTSCIIHHVHVKTCMVVLKRDDAFRAETTSMWEDTRRAGEEEQTLNVCGTDTLGE